MAEMREEIREYILSEFLPGEPAESLTDEVELVSSRILDSLATLKLVTFLEDSYGIEFAAHEVGADNLDTIGRIVDFVQSRRSPT